MVNETIDSLAKAVSFVRSSGYENNFCAPPNFYVLFYNPEGFVGLLDFNGPELKFEGKADESASIFIESLTIKFKDRLAQERKPLEDRIKELEKELYYGDWCDAPTNDFL